MTYFLMSSPPTTVLETGPDWPMELGLTGASAFARPAIDKNQCSGDKTVKTGKNGSDQNW